MSHAQYDDAVVGAGIVGLAHAYQLARRGRRVVVFERNARASSASVRNFGMLWPIGQPFGPLRRLADDSLRHWLEVLKGSGSWYEQTGSLHLAYRDDEAQVLREFAEESRCHGYPVEILGPSEVAERAKPVVQEGLHLAVGSRLETCVDPREVVARLPEWLGRRFDVEFQFNRAITAVEMPGVFSGRAEWSANRLWVCCGDELGLLFADQLRHSGLVRCKLQMMRSQPQDDRWRLGPMLAAGLTLRHYASFGNCPTLPALRQRVRQESPWLDRYGIHVLVSQNGRGELVIGDSHEYDDAIEPFDKAEIDEWILGYLRTFLDAPGLRVAARWHGTYAKHPSKPYLIEHPADGVSIIAGLGGAGMTLSFGLAEQVVSRELGESEG